MYNGSAAPFIKSVCFWWGNIFIAEFFCCKNVVPAGTSMLLISNKTRTWMSEHNHSSLISFLCWPAIKHILVFGRSTKQNLLTLAKYCMYTFFKNLIWQKRLIGYFLVVLNLATKGKDNKLLCCSRHDLPKSGHKKLQYKNKHNQEISLS